MSKKNDKPKSRPTVDGYSNFVSRVGLNNDNTLSAGDYQFNQVTRNRIQLEAAYRGSWITGQVIDAYAEDMTRAGIDITTNDGEENLEDLNASITQKRIWTSLASTIKWGRLYGGAIAYIQIEGQDPSTPLDVETVAKGQFQGLIVYDRWQVNPVATPSINSGPDMGLPVYYQIVNNPTGLDTAAPSASGEFRIHHSRVIRFIGIELPYWQAIVEQMWGESVLERLWDRLIAFDNVTMSTANLVDRANLRTVSIEGLRQIIAAGGSALDGLYAQFDMMRAFQTNQGLTLLDAQDKSDTTSYSFSGLPETILQFGQQLSGACQIPLVRLFGQSPVGLGATGEADIRMYYDSINAQQEARLRNPMHTVLQVMWRSTFGYAAPIDLKFKFTSLWQLTEADKANNKKVETETIIGAYESTLLTKAGAMKDMREIGFTNITDEDIADAEAQADEPPMPGEMGPVEPGVNPDGVANQADPNAIAIKVPNFGKPAPTGDSSWQKIVRFVKGE